MIATSIAQAYRLLELGLEPVSADMFYDDLIDHITGELFVPSDGSSLTVGKRRTNAHLPAWSLSALLEVMPIKITKDKVEYKLAIFPSGLFSTHSDTSTWTVQYCGIEYSYRSKDRFPKLAIFKEYTLIDAVHKMVCWLLEQGLIKKGGER